MVSFEEYWKDRGRKHMPGWGWALDAETCIEITVIMYDFMYKCGKAGAVPDDSRVFTTLVEEMTFMFQAKHFGDRDYWNSLAYLEEVYGFTSAVSAALHAEPGWLNRQQYLPNAETLYDLMRRHPYDAFHESVEPGALAPPTLHSSAVVAKQPNAWTPRNPRIYVVEIGLECSLCSRVHWHPTSKTLRAWPKPSVLKKAMDWAARRALKILQHCQTPKTPPDLLHNYTGVHRARLRPYVAADHSFDGELVDEQMMKAFDAEMSRFYGFEADDSD